MKKCNVCKETKSISYFYVINKGNVCKECIRKKRKEAYRNKVLNIPSKPISKKQDIDEFFEEGYQERIRIYIDTIIIPELNNYFIKY